MTGITTTFDPPLATDDRVTFSAKAFAVVAALNAWAAEANALGANAQVNADITAALTLGTVLPGFSGTSTTSLTLATGAQSLTTQSGKSWVPGQVVVVHNGLGAYMKGAVTSYSGTALVLNITSFAGTGTFASWYVTLSYTALAEAGANTSITSLDGVLVGKGAGSISTNTRYGALSLTSNTTGAYNVAMGSGSLQANTTGQRNVAVGWATMNSATVGWYNVAIGAGTMPSGEGTGNTAIGDGALGSLAYGYGGNVMIGGRNSAGGFSSVFNIGAHNDRVAIGSAQVTNAYIQVAWTVVSDARDKTNFAPVPHGLDFVNALKPTAYQYTLSRDDKTPNGPVRYGFKAQDVLALEGDSPVIVDAEDAEKLRFNDQALIAVMAKAIQELSAKVTALEALLL